MRLPSYKHLKFTNKSILIGVLSVSFIIAGCDKKSGRKIPGTKVGSAHYSHKGDPGNMTDPCVTPQARPGVNGTANEQNTPSSNGQVAVDSSQNSNNQEQNKIETQKAATHVVTTQNGQQVPCVPGSSTAQKAGTAGETPQRPGQGFNPMLAPQSNQQTSGTAENEGGNSSDFKQTSDGTSGKGQGALTKLEDLSLHEAGKDEEGQQENPQSKATNSIQQLKKLNLILNELSNFYVNAVWAATADRYVTPENYFGYLGRLVKQAVGQNKFFIKKEERYTEESRNRTCSGTGVELQTYSGSSEQRLFLYDCYKKQPYNVEAPVLVFAQKGNTWNLKTNIQGMEQLIDSTMLGYISTIDIDSKENTIPFKPKCVVKVSTDDNTGEDRIRINEATCNYWGQRYTLVGEKSPKTLMFEEFHYDADENMKFEVKARLIDFDNQNQICVKNQITRTANNFDDKIHIKDIDDNSECEKRNKDIEDETARLNRPAVFPASPSSVAQQQPLHSAGNIQENTTAYKQPLQSQTSLQQREALPTVPMTTTNAANGVETATSYEQQQEGGFAYDRSSEPLDVRFDDDSFSNGNSDPSRVSHSERDGYHQQDQQQQNHAPITSRGVPVSPLAREAQEYQQMDFSSEVSPSLQQQR